MTEPITAAGRALLGALAAQDRANDESVAVDWAHGIFAIEAEARQQDGSALRTAARALVDSLQEMTAATATATATATALPDQYIALAEALAALPPSAPPALDGSALLTIFREERDAVPRGPDHYWQGYQDALETAMRRVEMEEVRIAAEYARLEPER